MTPFEAYKLYLAMRQHFERDSYDFIKYRGSVPAKDTTFDTRKDKYMFYKLSKKPDPKGLLIANLCVNPKMWVGDLLDAKAEENFVEWNKRQQSLTYWFKQELNNLPDDLDELLAVRYLD
jgi:hypothetical protein